MASYFHLAIHTCVEKLTSKPPSMQASQAEVPARFPADDWRRKARPIAPGSSYPAREHCSHCGLCDTYYIAHVKDACAFLGDGMSRIGQLEEQVGRWGGVMSGWVGLGRRQELHWAAGRAGGCEVGLERGWVEAVGPPCSWAEKWLGWLVGWLPPPLPLLEMSLPAAPPGYLPPCQPGDWPEPSFSPSRRCCRCMGGSVTKMTRTSCALV